MLAGAYTLLAALISNLLLDPDWQILKCGIKECLGHWDLDLKAYYGRSELRQH